MELKRKSENTIREWFKNGQKKALLVKGLARWGNTRYQARANC
jgi:hypothetical protein